MIHVEVEVAAPPDEVFGFFTDPALLVRWIGSAAELDPRPGGTFRFELFDGEFCSGRYVEVEPPRRVVFTWGWESGAIDVAPGSSTVEVDLEATVGGTLVRLVHRDLGTTEGMHDEGWRMFLARLIAAAGGDPVPPDPAVPYATGERTLRKE